MFLINRGVVQDTVQNILAINFTRPKEVLQSCFDMLGELVKFNMNGFEIMANELAETDKVNILLIFRNFTFGKLIYFYLRYSSST
jgi:hypothetical protein